MPNSVDFSGRPFHFIGIGGIGMSALAHILIKRGIPVSGSDIRLNHLTQHLKQLGVHIFCSQDASNVEFFSRRECESVRTARATAAVGVATPHSSSPDSRETSRTVAGVETSQPPKTLLPQVICSTAIHPANSEYRTALDLGCPIFHRSDVLAALINDYQSIAVAGTHGKTTTSSLIGHVLLNTGIDPTIVVGGEVDSWGGNACLGQGPYLVAEADESDGSLAKLSAYIGVVTNIELDHPDHYDTLDEVVNTFRTFSERCNTLVGCIDCEVVRDRMAPEISYSLNPAADATYTADQIVYGGDGTQARIWERGTLLGQLTLPLLGKHNLSNALAAVAVGRLLGLEFEAIAAAIATFEGAHRRFECRGEHNDILFVDDYAHHPSEISATLAAARLQVQSSGENSRQRVVAIFQPHRYSRAAAFLSEFGQCFGDADEVVISDIYSAGEPNLSGISSQDVAEAIAANHTSVHYQSSLQSVRTLLESLLRPGDLAIFLGAGNLNQIIPEVMAFHQERADDSLPHRAFKAS